MNYNVKSFNPSTSSELDSDCNSAIRHLVAFDESLYPNLPTDTNQLRKVEVESYLTLVNNIEKLPSLSNEVCDFLKLKSSTSSETFDLLIKMLIEAADFLYCKSQTSTRNISKMICETLDTLYSIQEIVSKDLSSDSYSSIKSKQDTWSKLVDEIEAEQLSIEAQRK